MRRFILCVLGGLLCLSALVVQAGEVRQPREKEMRVPRIVREVVKFFIPRTTGDFLSPPHP